MLIFNTVLVLKKQGVFFGGGGMRVEIASEEIARVYEPPWKS